MARELHSDACEPWGYVALAVAAVMTRATGVRHIYLIFGMGKIIILGMKVGWLKYQCNGDSTAEPGY